MAESRGHDEAAIAAVMQQAQAEAGRDDAAVAQPADSTLQPPPQPPMLDDRGDSAQGE